MSSFYDLVNSYIRSTETVLVTVDALSVTDTSTPTPQSIETSESWHDRRVLAVISHKDEWALTEEGALFVYKLSSSAASPVHNLDVQRIYPLYGQFSIVMSQMRRSTLDLSVANSKAVLDQPRSGFSLTINPAEGLEGDAEASRFYATDVHSLGLLVAECKRLKGVAEVESSEKIDLAQSQTHFSWLRPYYSKYVHLSLLSSTPPDLRVVNKGLLQRLSPASAGLPGDDNTDIRLIRDEWIRDQARSLSQRGKRRISVRLGTFNVNGKLPSQDLSLWIQGTRTSDAPAHKKGISLSLPPIQTTSPISLEETAKQHSITPGISTSTLVAESMDDDPSPDIFAIGFQELDLSTEALIYSLGTTREDAWCMAIFAALGEKAVNYEKLASKQLVGMLIVILVKKTLKSCFGEVRADSAGSGILGVMGNKGATAVRLTFTPSLDSDATRSNATSPTGAEQPQDITEYASDAGPLTLTFVNAHLAAFDEMTDRRNQEFHELSKRLAFGRNPNGTEVNDYDDDFGMEPATSVTINAYETDVLFWMGDLNYRVDIPDTEFRELLVDKEWYDRLQALIRYDQLRKSIVSKKAFEGFIEHPITHLPTYRFSPGLAVDELGYDRKRRPAWTDRILYIASPLCDVVQHSYTSYPQITMSDHRPVAADFSIHFDLYERARYEWHVRQLYREVQALDASHERPTIKVDQSFLDFGEIKYQTFLAKKVVIENVGKIPCAWRFVSVQPDSPIHPEWLLVKPMTGMLLPGEETEIALTVHIDNRIASSLNLGPRDMSGTLILHTVLGKDHFIAISGEYLPSCFGNKLTTLTRLPGPIRTLTSSKELRAENHPLNAPREVMRLVNWLMGSTTLPKDLFLTSPEASMVETIRECLDTGEEFPWPPGNESATASHAFARTLLELLDSLIEPVVPPILHTRCVQMMSRDEAFELLDALQPAAVNVWITLTAFLHFICQSSGDPGYPERIADIFTPVLMRDDPESVTIPISPIKKRKFFLYFIT